MTEKLELQKGGKLLLTQWVYDKTTEKGYYEDQDVTEYAARFLFDICVLEKGIILKDIFLLINSDMETFKKVLGNWCEEFIKEGLFGPEKPYTGEYTPDDIEYLELVWNLSYDDKEPIFSGHHRPELYGVGFELKEDKLFKWGEVECPKGTRQSYGVSLTSANELVNFPIKLNNKLTITDDNHEHENWMKPIGEYKNPVFTLGNILDGIFWEISFYGSPEKRKKILEELNERSREIEEGTAKLIPMEEVFKDLKEKFDKE